MRKILLLLIVLPFLFASCSSDDTDNLETESDTKYYTFDFVKIADMTGKSYDAITKSLIDYKIKEEVSVGVRKTDYFLKDDVTYFSLELQESSENKVREIAIQPSFMMYSKEEQFEMFVKYIQVANSEFSSGIGWYEDYKGKLHRVSSVDKMITLLQDEPTLRRDNTLWVGFRYKENIKINVWYISNKFRITFE